MGFSYTPPTDGDFSSGGGNHIQAPGFYHLIVGHTADPYVPKNGTPWDSFLIEAVCCDGTTQKDGVCTEKKRTIGLKIGYPKPTDKDGGKFRSEVVTRVLVALELITPAEVAAGKAVQLDDAFLKKAMNRQFVAALKWGDEKDGKKYLELDAKKIYHIDDPEAAHVPKDAQVLAFIPTPMRRKPEYFAPVSKDAGSGAPQGNGHVGNGAAGSGTPGATTTSSGVDLAGI